VAHDGPTVRQAAQRTAACLEAHGWQARLADRGHTSNAIPRGSAWHASEAADPGSFSVAFNRWGGKIHPLVYRQGLTYRQGKLATACTRSAVR
jgi:hypothetical protein